jgi:hypothetical protein
LNFFAFCGLALALLPRGHLVTVIASSVNFFMGHRWRDEARIGSWARDGEDGAMDFGSAARALW